MSSIFLLLLLLIHLLGSCYLSYSFLFTATVARPLEHLGSQVLTMLDGNPPLYVTRKRTGKQEDIHINNALIIRSRSNVQRTNESGKKQVHNLLPYKCYSNLAHLLRFDLFTG